MDSVALVELTRALVDIDSTTGREGECARVLADRLHALGYAVEVQPVEGDRANVIGRIGNLSASGVLLIASKPLVDDALYQFRFALPDNNGAQNIEVGAHVLWIDGASAPGQSWVGLRFLGLSTETTQRLRRWAEAGSTAAPR